MPQYERETAGPKIIVSIDSYDDCVLKGRLHTPFREPEHFSSLSQFFLNMESLLDEWRQPQAYTSIRKFSTFVQPVFAVPPVVFTRRGTKATFELHVIFRQHTSWQGVILWREKNLEQSFRSVLELVILMDSALRSMDGNCFLPLPVNHTLYTET